MTVTPTEWKWRRWRLGEGEFKTLGPASKPRPAEFPRVIPPAWWARLVAFLARRKKPAPPPKPPAYSGVLVKQGLVLRNPGGGVENIDEMAFEVEQAEFEDGKQTDRAGANDQDVRFRDTGCFRDIGHISILGSSGPERRFRTVIP